MTKEKWEEYAAAAVKGTIPDDENPIYLFSITSTKLLVMALNKEFSLTQLARMELANRGKNMKGEWVGFQQAAALLKKYNKQSAGKSRTTKGKRP